MPESAEYRFTRDAQNDLRAIAQYGIEAFGSAQVVIYLAGLRDACATLAAQPNPGTACHGLLKRKRTVWRLRYGSHVIYYRIERKRAVVIGVLHRSRLPHRHL